MALGKTHKRRKSSRFHGRGMGTCGTGTRKKNRGSGMRGGKGMSGSGKRADHKKTLVTKLYGHGYFGKQGITSMGTKRDKRERINLDQIGRNIDALIKSGIAKKDAKGFTLNLKNHKILGTGEVKEKLIITAKEASASAIEKVTKAGGEIILLEKKVKAPASEKKKEEVKKKSK